MLTALALIKWAFSNSVNVLMDTENDNIENSFVSSESSPDNTSGGKDDNKVQEGIKIHPLVPSNIEESVRKCSGIEDNYQVGRNIFHDENKGTHKPKSISEDYSDMASSVSVQCGLKVLSVSSPYSDHDSFWITKTIQTTSNKKTDKSLEILSIAPMMSTFSNCNSEVHAQTVLPTEVPVKTGVETENIGSSRVYEFPSNYIKKNEIDTNCQFTSVADMIVQLTKPERTSELHLNISPDHTTNHLDDLKSDNPEWNMNAHIVYDPQSGKRVEEIDTDNEYVSVAQIVSMFSSKSHIYDKSTDRLRDHNYLNTKKPALVDITNDEENNSVLNRARLKTGQNALEYSSSNGILKLGVLKTSEHSHEYKYSEQDINATNIYSEENKTDMNTKNKSFYETNTDDELVSMSSNKSRRARESSHHSTVLTYFETKDIGLNFVHNQTQLTNGQQALRYSDEDITKISYQAVIPDNVVIPNGIPSSYDGSKSDIDTESECLDETSTDGEFVSVAQIVSMFAGKSLRPLDNLYHLTINSEDSNSVNNSNTDRKVFEYSISDEKTEDDTEVNNADNVTRENSHSVNSFNGKKSATDTEIKTLDETNTDNELVSVAQIISMFSGEFHTPQKTPDRLTGTTNYKTENIATNPEDNKSAHNNAPFKTELQYIRTATSDPNSEAKPNETDVTMLNDNEHIYIEKEGNLSPESEENCDDEPFYKPIVKSLVNIYENVNQSRALRNIEKCTSFGDLRTLSDERAPIEKMESEYDSGAHFDRAKSLGDLRSGSSVKNLRQSYSSDANVSEKQSNKVNEITRLFEAKSSSFNKFDALQKKTVLHVRSGDAGKASEKFKNGTPQNEKNCRVCSKPVFQMEMISAEKSCFHKNCFRCATCSKNLTVETYASHESVLYCKPHFKALFAPKVIEDVPASDKPDLGLDEISKSLNVKSRYQVFEHTGETDRTLERTPSTVSVKRSPSILSKLAKFHAKGMDIGVTDESLNSVHYEESSSEAEDEVEEDGDADIELRKSKRIQKEVPVTFGKMSDIKTKFENGHTMTKEERREERKQEIQNIRSRLFMGKQAKIKEMYQQAVLDSEQGITSAKNKPLVETCDKDKAKNIKEKFEKGEFFNQDDDSEENFKNKDTEDMSVFDAGISKKSRSLFLELDATAAARLSQAPSVTPVAKTPEVRKASQVFARDDIVKCGDEAEDVKVETAEISSKFKFFETYKPAERERRQFRITPPRDGVNKIDSPDREVYHDPDVVRAEDCVIEDPDIAVKSHTATKMLFIFRQMEENKEPAAQAGLKPLKRFTPPPPEDSTRRYRSDSESQDGSECEESEEEPDNTTARNGDPVDYVRSSDKFEDEFLKQAQNDARAKQLRAKFEKWESNEIRREQSGINLHEECTDNSQIESAKSLRARFESMGEITSADKIPRAKVNRFV